jgi:hypothetical protein
MSAGSDGLMERRHERQAGMGTWADVLSETRAQVIAEDLTRRERQVIRQLLADGGAGAQMMLSRARLGTGNAMMEALYIGGLVNGAGTRDERGTGNTPDSSWWWLTARGEQIAQLLAQPAAKADAA